MKETIIIQHSEVLGPAMLGPSFFQLNLWYLNIKGLMAREESPMTLTEQLKDVVENYFSRYPHVSINSLAMKSGVGATTLRRIVNQSIKGEPAPHTVLNLASALSNEKQLTSLIKNFDGPIGQLLEKTFAPYLEVDSSHVMKNDINEELKDWVKYAIYKLSANRKGVSRIQVSELFGKLGLDRLDELIENKFLEEEQSISHANEKNFSLDVSIAAGHLSELVRFYKPTEVSKGNNIFYTLSETLNEEGIQKIKEIQKEAVKKIFEVMNENEFAGEIPYFSLNLADTFDLTENKGVLQ